LAQVHLLAFLELAVCSSFFTLRWRLIYKNCLCISSYYNFACGGGRVGAMTVTVSDLFREYEDDFARLQREVDERLSGPDPEVADQESSHASRLRKLEETERRTKEADQALRQLEMEARTMPPDTRAALAPKLKGYRADLVERRKRVEAAKSEAQRQDLLGDGDANVFGKSMKDRERLLDAKSTMDKARMQLEEAKQQSFQSEQIGIEVINDLREQRDVIMRSRGNVGKIGEHMGAARTLLDGMFRRALANKLIVYVVVALMVFMLAFLAYFMLIGGGSGSGGGDVSATERPVGERP